MNKSYLYLFVDIDGTCTDGSGNDRFVKHTLPEGVTEDRSNVVYLNHIKNITNPADIIKDRPIPEMRSLLSALAHSFEKVNIVYLTSRDVDLQDVSVQWFRDNGFPYAPILMRMENDEQPYHLYKEQVVKTIVGENVSWAQVILIDDDPRDGLVDVCKRNKWLLLKAVTGHLCH